MNLNRIATLFSKEVQHGAKNFIVIFAIVIPIAMSLVVSLVFGEWFSQTPRIGLYDSGQSQLIGLFEAQDYLDVRIYNDEAALRYDTEQGVVHVGVGIPANFDEAIQTGTETDLDIFFWGEASVNNQSLIVTALASNIVEVSGRDVPVSVQAVPLGEGSVESWSERLLPLLVLMAIILGGALIPAVSLVDEKQKQTLRAITTTPASLLDVLAAKALLGVGVSALMGLVILVLNQAFGAQPAALLFVLTLSAIAAATFGILMGALVKDMNMLFTVLKSMGLVLYAPALVELVPQLPAWIGQIFPTYYMMTPITEIAQHGATLADIAPNLLILAIMIALLLGAMLVIIGNDNRREALAL